jgi:hypothetical protein
VIGDIFRLHIGDIALSEVSQSKFNHHIKRQHNRDKAIHAYKKQKVPIALSCRAETTLDAEHY